MGVDVCGKMPTSRSWGGLTFRVEMAPTGRLRACARTRRDPRVRAWHANNGDGLTAEQSVKLADKLDALIESGAVAGYIEKFGKGVEVLGEYKRDIDPSQADAIIGNQG